MKQIKYLFSYLKSKSGYYSNQNQCWT